MGSFIPRGAQGDTAFVLSLLATSLALAIFCLVTILPSLGGAF
jgi:hypothetical protein